MKLVYRCAGGPENSARLAGGLGLTSGLQVQPPYTASVSVSSAALQDKSTIAIGVENCWYGEQRRAAVAKLCQRAPAAICSRGFNECRVFQLVRS